MSVHFTPAHKYDTDLDKGGGLRHFCSVYSEKKLKQFKVTLDC